MTREQARYYFSQEEWYYFVFNIARDGQNIDEYLMPYTKFCWDLVSAFTWGCAVCPPHVVNTPNARYTYWNTIANDERNSRRSIVLENALRL